MSEVIYFKSSNMKYGSFSNFFIREFQYKDLHVNNVEAVFQCEKTTDLDERFRISQMRPSDAKQAGRRVALRSDWEQVKFQIMYDACYAKFNQNPDLRDFLLSTGDALLVENTTGWHDNVWGHCSCPKCANKVHQNWLGLTLMLVLNALNKERKDSKGE